MVSNDFNKQKSWRPPAFGLLAAIAVITAIFASGLPAELGALSLIPLVGLFWYLGRFSRAEMGFVWGRGRYYSLGLLQPACLPRASSAMLTPTRSARSAATILPPTTPIEPTRLWSCATISVPAAAT